MKNDYLKMSPPESLAFIRRIWKKVQQKGLSSLSEGDRPYARIMLDHQAVLDLNGALNDPHVDLDDPEHPVFHILIHATIEEQLQLQDPVEAVRFFNSMRKRNLDPHETIHLMGLIFQYAMFSSLGEPDGIVEAHYQSLLEEYQEKDPKQISLLMEKNLQSLLSDPEPSFLFDYPTIDSKSVRRDLDHIIDQVAESGNPVGVRSANGNEAVIVPVELISLLSDMPRIFSGIGQPPDAQVDPEPPRQSSARSSENTAASQPLPLSHAFKDVLQLKISLRGARPPIWRRIQIPADYTFWDLHLAIQDVMGWEDTHLHEFSIRDKRSGRTLRFGIPAEFDADVGLDDIEVNHDWTCRVSDHLTLESRQALYVYDFGDDWLHDILLEEILPRTIGFDYPICIKGKRACPPEDSGGIAGYQRMLDIMANPGHPEYESLIEWLGEEFDPAAFDRSEVKFIDSRKHLQRFL